MPTQVIELRTEKTELKESALEVTQDLTSDIKENDILGVYSVLCFKSGRYKVYGSKGIERLKTLGILEEIKHTLLNQ